MLSEDTLQQYQDPGISIRQKPSTKTLPSVPIEPETIDYFGQKNPPDLRKIKSNFSLSLDPFGDSWRKVKLSRNITVYLYSAFYDDRISPPSVRINAAAPTKFKVHTNKNVSNIVGIVFRIVRDYVYYRNPRNELNIFL